MAANQSTALLRLKCLLNNINKNCWIWEWAINDLRTSREAHDNYFIRKAQHHLFSAMDVNLFFNIYGLKRTGISSVITQKKLQDISVVNFAKGNFKYSSYIEAWESLANEIKSRNKEGKEKRGISAASKLLWCYQPNYVPIYDANAKVSLAAYKNYRFSKHQQDYPKAKREEYPVSQLDVDGFSGYYSFHRKFTLTIRHVLKRLCIPQADWARFTDKVLWLIGTPTVQYRSIRTIYHHDLDCQSSSALLPAPLKEDYN